MLKTVALLLALTVSFSANALADSPKSVNVPAGDLTVALEMLEKQSGAEIVYRPELLKGLRTGGVKGTLSSEDAVTKLLKGTKLKLHSDRTGVLLITEAGAEGPAGSTLEKAAPARREDEATPRDRLPLAQTGQGQDQGAVSVGKSAREFSESAENTKLEEIIVTAQKREERLIDVPVPVTALAAASLIANNEVRMEDFYTRVPGLSLTTDTRGEAQISLRGLTTGINSGNPTVSITIDDIPYGSSTALGNAPPVPDIDPANLARIEVLRGPQGTLYGANSLGGLIKYVTQDPSTAGVTGRVQTDVNSVDQSGTLGYGVRGALNVPLSDSVAVRGSGFYRRDAGYIDNSLTGERDVNDGKTFGAFISGLWRPSDAFSAKFTALAQRRTRYGSPWALPDSDNLELPQLRGSNWTQSNLQAYSMTLKGNVGAASITALTGYSINSFHALLDDSGAFLTGLADQLFGLPGTGAEEYDSVSTRKLTQELRAVMPLGAKLDWLVGGFYTHEKSYTYYPRPGAGLFAVDPTNGATVANFWTLTWPSTYTGYAVFSDLTIHFSDRLDIQLGGRESWNRQSYSEIDSGLLGPLFGLSDPLITPDTHTNDNSFTYLVTPQYRFSPNLMLYARFASGYRPGGPNQACVPFGTPCAFGPDRTTNYEVGVKGATFNGAFVFDASAYYILWNQLQLQGAAPPLGWGFTFNGGKAKSQGIELSAQLKPLTGLTLGASLAVTDAKLTQDFPVALGTAYGLSGDRLPYSSRFSGTFSVEQEFSLTGNLKGFVGGRVAYVGDRYSNFNPAGLARSVLPAYTETNLHTGARYGAWTTTLFATNVFDRRGALTTFPFYRDTAVIQYIQPRTIGLTIDKTF